MSGVEIAIPVIAAVFALVSAFKDGGTIAEKIKERRQRKGAQLPNERLQRVLHQGAQEIESTQLEGVEEFGDAFQADAIIAGKIKDVTIVLQDSIIKQLAAASDNDNMNDFGPAINSIIQARKEAVNILNEHYMALQKRQAQGLPLLTAVTPPSGTGFSFNAPLRQHGRVHTLDSVMTGAVMEEPFAQPLVAPTNTSMTIMTSPKPKSRSRSGTWKMFGKRQSMDAGTSQQPQSPPASSYATPDNLEPPRRTDVTLNLPQSPPVSVDLPSPAIHRSSTVTSIFDPILPGSEVKPILVTNKYQGLCKGAFHAQNYRFKKAMEPSMREFEWMYHCKKCKFRLTADASQRGDPHFDDRIQTSSATINFRFLFLWKSHIVSKEVQSRPYKCMFCLLGKGESNVYNGEDQLFGHIMRHEGELLGTTVIQGMLEVSSEGIAAAGMESFDLYFPLNLRRRGSTVGSFMLPESALETGSNEISPISPRLSYRFSPRLSPHLSPQPASRNTRDISPGGSHSPTSDRGQEQRYRTGLSPEVIHTQTSLQAQPHRQSSTHTRDAGTGPESPNSSENVWRSERPRFAELDGTDVNVRYVELDATEAERCGHR